MRPLAALAAAAVIGLGVLAGCGEKDEPPTTGPVVTTDGTSTAQTPTTTTSVDEQTTTTREDEGGAAPTSPATAAQAFLSSPDAALVCDEVLAPEFLRTAYGDRTGCIAARRPASLADPNSKLEVGPESNAGVRVDAAPTGGLYDGDKLQITVVREGSAYLIADVKSNVPVGP